MMLAASRITTTAGQTVSCGRGTQRARWNAAASGQRRFGEGLNARCNTRRSRRGTPDHSAWPGSVPEVHGRPLTDSYSTVATANRSVAGGLAASRIGRPASRMMVPGVIGPCAVPRACAVSIVDNSARQICVASRIDSGPDRSRAARVWRTGVEGALICSRIYDKKAAPAGLRRSRFSSGPTDYWTLIEIFMPSVRCGVQ